MGSMILLLLYTRKRLIFYRPYHVMHAFISTCYEWAIPISKVLLQNAIDY